MDHHPSGRSYFGCRRRALLDNNRETGFVTNFFAGIYFERFPIFWSAEIELLSEERSLLALHLLLRAAAVRAPQALEVHFLRGTRILST
jgi:hypothetical protein